jgi:protein dithiol:quinone oxidoreductase
VLANPGFSCGFDALQPLVDSLPPAHWLPGVFKVAGLCETAYPPIFGLSLPEWSLLAFFVAYVPLVLSLIRNRRRIA